MAYYDSAAGYRVDRARVVQELALHGVPVTEYDSFFAENEPDSNGWYKAQSVLSWLGY